MKVGFLENNFLVQKFYKMSTAIFSFTLFYVKEILSERIDTVNSYCLHYFIHFDLQNYISTNYGPKYYYPFPINGAKLSIYCDLSPLAPKKGKKP